MFWQNKKVFLTGHTGFKCGWLSLWLQMLGAQVTGYSLEPPTCPNLFEAASVASEMRSIHGDLLDLGHLKQVLAECQPEIVFHLAALPIVRLSYANPVLTYATNVMGTVHLLEAVREIPSVSAVVVVTSDKCYENRGSSQGYRENDALGGHDPYSSSKACAEMVVSAYRSSFFENGPRDGRPAVASVRAGNVIGGGDWAQDRLIPDIIRAVAAGEAVKIRSPHATRPWQHVLEPLRGYLMLAEKLYADGSAFASAWNFGPNGADIQPVRWLAENIATNWGPAMRWEIDGGSHPHEDQLLQLDCSKAAQQLGWRPALRLSEALSLTVDWYRHFLTGGSARDKCMEQISAYCARTGFEVQDLSTVQKGVASE